MIFLPIAYKIMMLQILNQKGNMQRIFVEFWADGGIDAMENMFYSIDLRTKEEIGKDTKP
jgi:hypothetical protein